MTTWKVRLALAGMLVAVAGSAAAGVTVKFSNQEDYGNLTSVPQFRARVFQNLGDYFDKLGATLPAGTDLHVDVLDLDMAGPAQSMLGVSDAARTASGSLNWPHLHLRYRVTQGDKVIAEGDDQLTDMDYLARVRRVDTTLPAEKLLISDWFKAKVAAPTLAAR